MTWGVKWKYQGLDPMAIVTWEEFIADHLVVHTLGPPGMGFDFDDIAKWEAAVADQTGFFSLELYTDEDHGNPRRTGQARS